MKTFRPLNEKGRSFEFRVGHRESFDRKSVFDMICEDARKTLEPGTVFEIRERIPMDGDLLEGSPRRNIVQLAWYSAETPPGCPEIVNLYCGRPRNMKAYILLAGFIA